MAVVQRQIKNYGWIPDLPDHRDFKFKLDRAIKIPDHTDLRQRFKPTILDQSNLGSCVLNAASSAIQFDQFKEKKVQYTSSRLFMYYNSRVIEGTVNEDSGTMIRDAIKAVATLGVPPEVYWPYDINNFKTKPSENAFIVAQTHKALQYESLPQTLKGLTGCIAQGYPFIFGFSVYDGFESGKVADTGIVNLPTKDEKLLGGHGVLALAYNMKQKRILCQNSWGLGWGIKGSGYFTLPFDYVLNPDLADDFWVIRSIQ